tara:strand:- start:129149 stop:130858 length:1710 start_codon:yes stop_codon:yes gene_type:complete
MLILGLNLGMHDGAAALFDDYRVLGAVQLERLSRRKNHGNGYTKECVDALMSMAGVSPADVDAVCFSRGFVKTAHLNLGFRRDTNYRLRRLFGKDVFKEIAGELVRNDTTDPTDIVDVDGLKAFYGLRPDTQVFFANHHLSHALSALFYSAGDNTLVYTADGVGDNVHYSIAHADGQKIENFYGDDRWLFRDRDVNSLGLAYGYVTQALGFRMNRHEGKITGLAAFGAPELLPEFQEQFFLDERGVVATKFASHHEMRAFIESFAQTHTREVLAASIQALLETLIVESATGFLERTGADSLALAGGVFANVALNRKLAEIDGVRNIFIFPGMGDEGLAVGNVLQFLLSRDGSASWHDARRPLEDVYWGPSHPPEALERLAVESGFRKIDGDPAQVAAELIRDGLAGAIYQGAMEFGPRALGARSILASPSEKEINNIMNDRLGRTEFMPFAPVVLEEFASEVFDIDDVNAYAAKFMTITCNVKDAWRERIAAVVHVDGSARPQIIDRPANPLYFDILNAFHGLTGIPVLINTSFNVHEEPIVCTPAEALRALSDERVDFLVNAQGVYRK